LANPFRKEEKEMISMKDNTKSVSPRYQKGNQGDKKGTHPNEILANITPCRSREVIRY
jgi:hypothetical protein